MRTFDVPQRGKRGDTVASRNHYGPHHRKRSGPGKRRTDCQRDARARFARGARGWDNLTEEQRQAWDRRAPAVKTKDAFGRKWSLTGRDFYNKINNARRAIGQEPLDEPPAEVTFGPNPIGELTITNDGKGVALTLSVSTVPATEIRVYGSPPCNPGRRRCWDLRLLGLLPAPEGGVIKITAQYVQKYGMPEAGKRVFIQTRQQLNGWMDRPVLTSALVPPRPRPAAREPGRRTPRATQRV